MNNLFIFDTNVIISAALFQNSNPAKAYLHAIRRGKLLVSPQSLEELTITLLENIKFEKYIPLEKRTAWIEQYKSISTMVIPHVSIQACRDPKDDMFLELAVFANASCIVTGDKALLDLHPFRGIPILNTADFLKA